MKLLNAFDMLDFGLVVVNGQGLAKHPCLPSWCPDFSAARHYEGLSLGHNYRAGFPEPKEAISFEPLLIPGSALLSVRGFVLDAVRSVTRLTRPRARQNV